MKGKLGILLLSKQENIGDTFTPRRANTNEEKATDLKSKVVRYQKNKPQK